MTLASLKDMSDQPSDSSFSSTKRDISQLKQTASDAASDVTDAISSNAGKAKGQLKKLAADARREGSKQVDKAGAQFCDLLDSARAYAEARPLACLGVALLIGFLVGRNHRDSRE